MLLPRGDDLLKYRLRYFFYFLTLKKRTQNRKRTYSDSEKEFFTKKNKTHRSTSIQNGYKEE